MFIETWGTVLGSLDVVVFRVNERMNERSPYWVWDKQHRKDLIWKSKEGRKNGSRNAFVLQPPEWVYIIFLMYCCLVLQLEKAQEQERLLEESEKELEERREREKQLKKLIEEKEVGVLQYLAIIVLMCLAFPYLILSCFPCPTCSTAVFSLSSLLPLFWRPCHSKLGSLFGRLSILVN